MRYLILEEKLGFFLGQYGGIPLFSNILTFPIVKAYSFSSQEDAEEYIRDFKQSDTFSVISIDTKDEYIDVVDLIKLGYTKYTGKMVNYLPMISDKIH